MKVTDELCIFSITIYKEDWIIRESKDATLWEKICDDRYFYWQWIFADDGCFLWTVFQSGVSEKVGVWIHKYMDVCETDCVDSRTYLWFYPNESGDELAEQINEPGTRWYTKRRCTAIKFPQEIIKLFVDNLSESALMNLVLQFVYDVELVDKFINYRLTYRQFAEEILKIN